MSVALIQQARPRTAIILGSGLGRIRDHCQVLAEAPYAAVPEIGTPSAPGHAGTFALVVMREEPVLLAIGRRHVYEGLSATAVAASVRWFDSLGVSRLVVTNAAGAIAQDFQVGALMLIADHINLMGESPLIGPEFVDMTTAYDLPWREQFRGAARGAGVRLEEGVYAAVRGPQYETPAEVRMLRALGADAVGMSTVPEVIQARALGMTVAGISVLTNFAAGLGGGSLHHGEVTRNAGAALRDLVDLLGAAC